MNNQKKFRVWSSQLNKLLNLTEICFNFDGSVTVYYGVNIDEKFKCSTWDVMQHTGRENIYESDIVQDDEGDVYTVQWDNEQSKYVANLIDAEGSIADVFDLNEVSCIVIGNIYENPELLKEV